MPSTVQKWGNSLAIRLPKLVAEQFDLTSGSVVEFDTTQGALTIVPARRRRPKLKALLARAKGPSPYRGLDKDGPVGREQL